MFDLKDKVMIVTGAGSGIGRELTLQLINQGVKVAACDINEKTLEETTTLASNKELLKTYVLDIADAKKVAAFPKMVKADFKNLHGVINNAGIIQPFVKIIDLSEKSVERVMAVNFYGVVNMTRAVINELDATTDTFISNVSSMGGFLPVPGQGIYGASKAAVKLFTEALYTEMRDTRIHVSIVLPGAIATNIALNSLEVEDLEPLQKKSHIKYKTTRADVAAGIIINGIEEGKLKILVGSDAKKMDKLYRLTPVKAINMMAKMIGKIM